MLLCLIVPIFTWNLIPVNCDWQGRAKIFILGLFAIGIAGFITYTVRLARWFYNMTGTTSADYRTKRRVEYLKKLPESEQLSVWGPATWTQLENHPSGNAREIITVFFDRLSDNLSDDTHIRSTMLLDFLHNIDAVHLYDVHVYDRVLSFSITRAFDLSTYKPPAKGKPSHHTLYMRNISKDLF